MKRLCEISELKKSLRRQLCQIRQTLDADFKLKAAEQMTQRLISHPLFLQCHTLSAFVAHQGEMDPRLIIEHALKQNKHCYLPIINPSNTNTTINTTTNTATNTTPNMIFYAIDANTQYHPNQYGILEPKLIANTKFISATELDLVLVPLVAIDKQGNRLGMGGGFYDRVFEFKNEFKKNQRQPSDLNKPYLANKPYLLGLAYDFQYIDDIIPTTSFDVPLDGLITESTLILF